MRHPRQQLTLLLAVLLSLFTFLPVMAQSTPKELVELGRQAYQKKQYTKAYNYYKRAYDMGYGEAAMEIGYLHYFGDGRKKDDGMAYKFFTEAASKGVPKANVMRGNLYYYDSNLKLTNPSNDATDLAARLSKLGFTVVRSLNQTKQGMDNAIQTFSSRAKGADVALFFYAGHGIQYQGDNYLVPVDAQLPSEEYVKYNCTNANIVLDVMERLGCNMKIVILDACRNNPFARSWHRSTAGGGLGIMNAPKGTFIAFSTSPGDVALDGTNGERNSPYTTALLQTLDKQGLSITDFFQEVLERVATATNERQTPWTSNSFRGKFVFNP